MSKNTSPTVPGSEDREKQLSPHIPEFLRLMRVHDEAVRAKNEQAVQEARYQLELFYGSLKDEEQYALADFMERQIPGKVIEDQRSKWVQALHVPHRFIGASVEPVAKLTGRTFELLAMTLGWTVRGTVRGLRESFRGVFHSRA